MSREPRSDDGSKRTGHEVEDLASASMSATQELSVKGGLATPASVAAVSSSCTEPPPIPPLGGGSLPA